MIDTVRLTIQRDEAVSRCCGEWAR